MPPFICGDFSTNNSVKDQVSVNLFNSKYHLQGHTNERFEKNLFARTGKTIPPFSFIKDEASIPYRDTGLFYLITNI